MRPEETKARTNRFVEEVINQNHQERIPEYIAANYVEHVTLPGFPTGIEGTKQFFTLLHSAFPDFHYTIEDTMMDGDMVSQRVKGHGTMRGEFLGMPATGKHADWDEFHITRVNPDGKIVEHWANLDQMGMLLQLGLAQMPGA